jgi:hypothetical protein
MFGISDNNKYIGSRYYYLDCQKKIEGARPPIETPSINPNHPFIGERS